MSCPAGTEPGLYKQIFVPIIFAGLPTVLYTVLITALPTVPYYELFTVLHALNANIISDCTANSSVHPSFLTVQSSPSIATSKYG